MGGKKSFKLRYDAAVTLTFCFASLLVLVLDQFIFKNASLVQKIFSLPGTLSKSVAVDTAETTEVFLTEGVFNFQNPFHYVRLILYIFGSKSLLHFLISFAFILPLGTQMEERYGSVALGIMILVTTLVTGVLNVCVVPATLCGAGAIALMLVLLSSITSLSKSELPISALAIFILCIAAESYLCGTIDKTKTIALLAKIAGALCGSMFGFLTAPKSRRASPPKTNSSYKREDSYGNSETTKKARESFMERIRREKRKKKFDEETTVIGSINI